MIRTTTMFPPQFSITTGESEILQKLLPHGADRVLATFSHSVNVFAPNETGAISQALRSFEAFSCR